MSEKSRKIDLFNCTPKRYEGTEINTVRKGIPAINHTFTEEICTHAVCILALKKLKCMSATCCEDARFRSTKC